MAQNTEKEFSAGIKRKGHKSGQSQQENDHGQGIMGFIRKFPSIWLGWANFLLPEVMRREAIVIFRDNFGFSRSKFRNNLKLVVLIIFIMSKFFVNPAYDRAMEAVSRVWNQVEDQEIDDDVYFNRFYRALWRFLLYLFALIFVEEVIHIVEVSLSVEIVAKKKIAFAKRYLNNFVAYGIQLDESQTEVKSEIAADEQKSLQVVKLFQDIEQENALLGLWISRIDTFVDFITAIGALWRVSPPTDIALTSTYTITVPVLIVTGLAYSFVRYFFSGFFEKPLLKITAALSHATDKVIRQLTQVQTFSESICWYRGEEYELRKLIQCIHEESSVESKYHRVNLGRRAIETFFMNISWLVPITVCLPQVRRMEIRREQLSLCMINFRRMNSFLIWSQMRMNFHSLRKIRDSTRRLALFDLRESEWEITRKEISSKLSFGSTVEFSGTLFADGSRKRELANGEFKFSRGDIVHLSAPSGCGKTSLMRAFAGINGNYDGSVKLPNNSLFLPSQVYVLGEDDPLLQTLVYPSDHSEVTEPQVKLVQTWIQKLKLPDHLWDDISRLRNSSEKALHSTNWLLSLSDGERKRVAFINVLMKMKKSQPTFVVLDEPFKGVDHQSQRVMIELLREFTQTQTIILFSNHEGNMNFNTHTLTFAERGMYKLVQA